VRINWEGSKPPTRRELEALRRAAAMGELRNGDTARPVRVNPSSSRGRAAKAAYERFHWGRKPNKTRNARLPDFSELYELGELRRVEYAARKGNETAIWVHDFSRPYPKLTATPRGRLGPIVGGAAFVTERGIEK
jgi:hypothetical protein